MLDEIISAPLQYLFNFSFLPCLSSTAQLASWNFYGDLWHFTPASIYLKTLTAYTRVYALFVLLIPLTLLVVLSTRRSVHNILLTYGTEIFPLQLSLNRKLCSSKRIKKIGQESLFHAPHTTTFQQKFLYLIIKFEVLPRYMADEVTFWVSSKLSWSFLFLACYCHLIFTGKRDRKKERQRKRGKDYHQSTVITEFMHRSRGDGEGKKKIIFKCQSSQKIEIL